MIIPHHTMMVEKNCGKKFVGINMNWKTEIKKQDKFDRIFEQLDMIREEIFEFKSPVTGRRLSVTKEVDDKFQEIAELLNSVRKEIYPSPYDMD